MNLFFVYLGRFLYLLQEELLEGGEGGNVNHHLSLPERDQISTQNRSCLIQARADRWLKFDFAGTQAGSGCWLIFLGLLLLPLASLLGWRALPKGLSPKFPSYWDPRLHLFTLQAGSCCWLILGRGPKVHLGVAERLACTSITSAGIEALRGRPRDRPR